jgi:hypothetical protein
MKIRKPRWHDTALPAIVWGADHTIQHENQILAVGEGS